MNPHVREQHVNNMTQAGLWFLIAVSAITTGIVLGFVLAWAGVLGSTETTATRPQPVVEGTVLERFDRVYDEYFLLQSTREELLTAARSLAVDYRSGNVDLVEGRERLTQISMVFLHQNENLANQELADLEYVGSALIERSQQPIGCAIASSVDSNGKVTVTIQTECK